MVDMTAHQDGQYCYVVECFDRCSRLTWLVPAERCVGTELAESVIRWVGEGSWGLGGCVRVSLGEGRGRWVYIRCIIIPICNYRSNTRCILTPIRN